MADPMALPGQRRGREERGRAVRAGVRVEVATVAWMLVEAIVALAAGALARSVLLTAFGLDSLIELVGGAVLLWRLSIEAWSGDLERIERAETHAARIVGAGLVLLCIYVVATAAASLLTRARPDASLAGIVLAVVAVIVMPLLAWRKRVIAARIDSAALRGDAACSITCAYMAGALLVGLGLTAALHWWWADSVAALGLLYWLVPEAREALEGARAGRGSCGCGDTSCAAHTSTPSPTETRR